MPRGRYDARVLEQMGGKGEGGVGTTPAGQPAKSTIRVSD